MGDHLPMRQAGVTLGTKRQRDVPASISVAQEKSGLNLGHYRTAVFAGVDGRSLGTQGIEERFDLLGNETSGGRTGELHEVMLFA